MSDLIKAVWGGDKPFAIFLTDGTKINIGGNKQGCWLQIGGAAKVVPMEVETCPGCAREIDFDDEGLYVEEYDKNLCAECGNDYQRSQAEDLTHY